MAEKSTTECCIRFFSLYRTRGQQGSEAIHYPEAFTRIVQTKNDRTLSFSGMQQEATRDIKDRFSKMLHPQARDFLFSDRDNVVSCFGLAQVLKDELHRSAWRAKAPKWTHERLESMLHEQGNDFFFDFKISNVHAYVFPTGILSLDIEVVPMFKVPDGELTCVSKMLLNCLNRAGEFYSGHAYKSVGFQRQFNDPRQKISINNRYMSNNKMALVLGLMGETISIGDVFTSLIDPTVFESLMGDRYLGFAYLRSGWDKIVPVFSHEEYVDLVRISQGESDKYMPDPDQCMPGKSGVLKTFDNVAFSLSCEGVSCWVKSANDQPFLQNQFKYRFFTIYYFLYLLCVHQRYALMSLSIEVERAAPSLPELKKIYVEKNEKTLEENAGGLYRLRAKVANFYMRAFFAQPASLTNHQRYYQVLHDQMGIESQFREVQQTTNELEYMISSINEHRQFERIGDLVEEQKKYSKNELLLTLVVELAALPYYTYNYLNHAVHLNDGLSLGISASLTIAVMGYTFFKFKTTQ